jgi:hypothetical protein
VPIKDVMANYYVSKDLEKREWRIKKEGAERVSSCASTQREAEKIAKELSANSGGGEVRIFRPHGGIRDSDTVAPGKDPHPPIDTKY